MDLRYIIKSLKIEMDRKKDAGENFSGSVNYSV